MSDTGAIQVLLAGRAGVYRTLQNIFGNEPSAEMLEQLCSGSTREVFMLFGEEQTAYGLAVDALINKAVEIKAGGAEPLDKLESAFVRLFVGPNPPEASPWETASISGDGALFRQTTLDVRNAYRVQGLLPAAYPNVADDHIAIELDFLTRLAERAEASLAAQDQASALNSLAVSEEFLQDHLSRWVSIFAANVSASRYADFYQEAAVTLEAFLPIDLDALEELKGALKS